MKSLATQPMRMFGLQVQGDFSALTMYTATNGDLIAFLKAPPRCPETANQRMIRERFKRIALAWHAMTRAQQCDWERVSMRANLRISGYNLYTYYHMRRDRGAIATLEQQTGIMLECPPFINLNPEGYTP